MIKPFLLLFLIPVALSAQSIIKGKVLSLPDKVAVPNASVFLSNSGVGDITQGEGFFALTDVKNGHYDLVVSCIGYETYHQSLNVYNGDITLQEITLTPKINELNEVKIVSAKNDPNRKKYVRMFIDAFFGKTENASECKLLNPDLLYFDFDENTDRLSASTNDFLILENKALGYRIKYLLESFLIDPGQHIMYYTGPFVFEEMQGTKAQKKKWTDKRVKAYLGSEMHFLRTCIEDRVTEEAFTVRKLVRTRVADLLPDSVIYANIKRYSKTPGSEQQLLYWTNQSHRKKFEEKLYGQHLDCHEFIKVTNVPGVYAIGYPDCLMINFGNEHSISIKDNTILTFKAPFSYFDSNGVIINPQSNIVEGYWGEHRIAELLPIDYALPQR
jgi:CarboxypepD_reg-like domain